MSAINFNNEVRFVFEVHDFSATRKFYEQVLNLAAIKEWDHGDPFGKGVVYKIGNLNLEFLESETVSVVNKAYLYIEVEEVEALWQKLKDNKAVKVLQKLEVQPWKHLNFCVEDFNGLELKFFKYLPE